jgi:hypothetical protein
MLPRHCALPTGFIAPCLPTAAPQPPSGAAWLHEIKHDGFRIIARKNGERVRLYSRPGNDLTDRFPRIVDALAHLRARSCVIDGLDMNQNTVCAVGLATQLRLVGRVRWIGMLYNLAENDQETERSISSSRLHGLTEAGMAAILRASN